MVACALNLNSHEVRGKIAKNDVGVRMLTFTVRGLVKSFLSSQFADIRGHDQRPISLEKLCVPFIPLRHRRLLVA